MAATQAGTGSDAGDRLLPAVISVSSLTKRYEDVEAVRGIDFEVVRGETFGFLGPNGAGKTTTIKILCTLASATSGSAKVAGHDAPSRTRSAATSGWSSRTPRWTPT
jgi:ABC-2 type transport system ATP-binding protein